MRFVWPSSISSDASVRSVDELTSTTVAASWSLQAFHAPGIGEAARSRPRRSRNKELPR